MNKTILLATFFASTAATLHAGLFITEVSAWGSSNSPYMTDWFEVTNTGTTAVNITGWKMDDNSNSFASSVSLTGITSINAGESVIFTETAATTSFLNTWFGGNAPAGLQIGNYTGTSVGLSGTADAVNLYNSSGVLQANVSFGVSPSVAPFKTFDNTADLSNTTISQLSAIGVNGAFAAVNDTSEIGSPGSAVPEPSTGLAFLGGCAVLLSFRRRAAAFAR